MAARIRFIKRGQELGFSLKEIAEILPPEAGSTTGCAEGVRTGLKSEACPVHSSKCNVWIVLGSMSVSFLQTFSMTVRHVLRDGRYHYLFDGDRTHRRPGRPHDLQRQDG